MHPDHAALPIGEPHPNLGPFHGGLLRHVEYRRTRIKSSFREVVNVTCAIPLDYAAFFD